MTNYIDGFELPIPKSGLDEYKRASVEIAAVWKEYGAMAYYEFVGDDMHLEGTRSFIDAVDSKEDEVVILGFVVFASREARDTAFEKVPNDPRMAGLVDPLLDENKLIFDASRMVYGGFKPL